MDERRIGFALRPMMHDDRLAESVLSALRGNPPPPRAMLASDIGLPEPVSRSPADWRLPPVP